MAVPKENTAQICAALIDSIRRGQYAPVYLLMGDEPYYPDLVCNEIIRNCIEESSRDFNQTICYGSDVSSDQIISCARQYPMMSERVLVVVKDANQCRSIEDLALYCQDPAETTVLVLLMRQASADKRKALYKAVKSKGVVLESQPVRDYEVPRWIKDHFCSLGIEIEPAAAALFAECAGNNLSNIAAEASKLLSNLPDGVKKVSVRDIETNIGVSREFSVFELTRLLSEKNAPKAIMTASRIASAPRFQMPMATGALYNHFSRILRYSLLLKRGGAGPEEKAKVLAGVNPYFYREYDLAVKNYPTASAMKAISLLCEYDYLSKGGDGGNSDPSELFVELVVKLCNL